jgi:hypothetical protein
VITSKTLNPNAAKEFTIASSLVHAVGVYHAFTNIRQYSGECVECDQVLEDMEYLYKGKSYCDDCYRAVKKLETIHKEKGT